MAITDAFHVKHDLPPEQARRLKALIQEADRRGLNISSELKRRKIIWPFDPDGYVIKNDGKRYEPSESQGLFIASKARFCGFIGSRGSGKSAAGAQKSLQKIARGEDGAILNPDFTNFKDSTWPELREWLPWEMVIPRHQYRKEEGWKPEKPFTLTFLNGVNVICKGLKDPNSARGPNINWLWYDEAQRDMTGESWKIAMASVRIGKDPQAWVTATPAGKYHWLFDFFVEEKIPPEVAKILEETGWEGTLVEWFHGTIEENKEHLDPMFLASLLYGYADDKYLKKQEIDGLFVTPEGSIGDRSWFDGKVLPKMPEETEDFKIRKRVRYWDLAASEKKISTSRRKKKDPDETVGTLMSWDGKKFYIEDQVAGRWLYEDILDHMHKTARRDGPLIPIFIEQEPGAGGKNQIAAIQKFFKEGDLNHISLQNFKVEGHRPEGDKVMRANIWFAEASRGIIYLIQGSWNDEFLDQVDIFPDGLFDDHVDSTSGARLNVAPIISWAVVPFMKL